MTKKQIAIGYDARGEQVKGAVIKAIKSLGHVISFEMTAGDYPVSAVAIAEAVALPKEEDESDFGILICGTGIGMSMAANKMPGVRAAHVCTTYQSQMCREHNDANVLCLGATPHDQCAKIEDLVTLFLETEFSGESRHCNRISAITRLETGGTCSKSSAS